MGQQWFFYDAITQTASTPDGPTLKSAGSVIPIRILGMNFARAGGTMSYYYKGVLIDVTGIQATKSYPLGVVQVNDDQQVVWIAVEGHRNLLIDDNYNVFADDSRATTTGAPSVTIHIIAVRSLGAKQVPVPTVREVVERGGGKSLAFESGADGKADVLLENLTETKVVTIATDSSGERIEAPTPLPVKGAEKGLVTQWVIIEFGKHK
jgi:hypothetical protein